MAAKKTEQDQGGTSEKPTDVVQVDVNQAAAAAAASQSDPATAGEQPSDPVAPAAPATNSPTASTADAAAAPGDATGTPELPGYLVTDVSSVLHDGTWYHQGDEISLNDKEATPLLRRRIIEPSRSKK
ncbi:hypothetical protein SAMN05216248_10467 [Pseudomonas simiae]|uniref:hypothetical protein n=1 Tax=Pseudomonas simiae TaxID=321846 RepID=UPI0008EF649C|nr:hypothetical protein [Pseudomonas simiae]SFB28578.1 hypothetical protein SAMN05216248_10467 [Pseudomonas simiae]